MAEKFYEKFQKNDRVVKAKNERKAYNKERNEYFEKKREGRLEQGRISAKDEKYSEGQGRQSFKNTELDAKILKSEKLFLLERLPRDSRNVLENFDNIVQGVRPLNSRQFQQLPKDIRALSHLLTDERENRRSGYMNANEELSAYVRYFTWWNLVRLTRVFASLKDQAFNLKDDDYCLDIGSGPLTAVIALWLSRPELREKKLTWYCMDLSSSTMALGEDLYLSVASKTPPKNPDSLPHWNIIRIKGSCGTEIRNKAALVVSANMFNEIQQKAGANEGPENLADSQIGELKKYTLQERSAFFIAEPGMPQAAHFVSLMRDRFISSGYSISSPCPHAENCPMSGKHARYGGSAKWCNFDFSTEDAPARLLKLSSEAGLPKDRAVISFVYAKKSQEDQRFEKSGSPLAENAAGGYKKGPFDSEKLLVRIASDMIRLPGRREGYYACSSEGPLLVINSRGKKIESGDLLELEKTPLPTVGRKGEAGGKKSERDGAAGGRAWNEKTGAGKNALGGDSFEERRDKKTGALEIKI